jgi:hypothetical protein
VVRCEWLIKFKKHLPEKLGNRDKNYKPLVNKYWFIYVIGVSAMIEDHIYKKL